MQNFEFHRPKTVEEAVAALKKTDGDGKLLAGGQSLIPVLKHELAMPSALISLADIGGLDQIAAEGDAVVIGAKCTHAEVAASDVVQGALPALAKLASHIGDPQVRHRGTLGGSVAHADPAADYPAAVLALGATIKTDRREIAADDFFTGFFETPLEDDEIVTGVSFPKAEKSAYAKFASPASKYAIVGVFVAKTSGGVRVAVTGAGPKVFRVTEMETALAANFSSDAIKDIKVSADDLNGDVEANAEYRAHLVTVMARRAVDAANG
ncbi:MAG: xanthine dehydrogenase family protein subunit M [Deltaproteobacteria bacterium]